MIDTQTGVVTALQRGDSAGRQPGEGSWESRFVSGWEVLEVRRSGRQLFYRPLMPRRYAARSELTNSGVLRPERSEYDAQDAAAARRPRCGTREVLRQWRVVVDPHWSPSLRPTVRWHLNGSWVDRRPDTFLLHPLVQELSTCTGLSISQTLRLVSVQRDTEEALRDWLEVTRRVDEARAYLAPVLSLEYKGHRREAKQALQRLIAIDADCVRTALSTLQLVERDL